VVAWVIAFLNRRVSNEDVIAGFVGSPEYFRTHYDNVGDMVFSAYEDVLSRAPDELSYLAWQQFLGS
jgi:hypothetical protein